MKEFNFIITLFSLNIFLPSKRYVTYYRSHTGKQRAEILLGNEKEQTFWK